MLFVAYFRFSSWNTCGRTVPSASVTTTWAMPSWSLLVGVTFHTGVPPISVSSTATRSSPLVTTAVPPLLEM